MRKLGIGMCLSFAALSALAATKPEISWSVMHPTELDPAYMKRVVEKATEYGGVDSFEMCGRCGYSFGGLNGLVKYEPYPLTAAAVDKDYVDQSRKRMNEIVALAHSIGKPIYYWHREGYMPKTIIKDIPGLLDENGEIDLLGKPYLDYLRWKVAAAFDAVPGLDGIVLTLTEADISIIHNSNPKRYPSDKVVDTINRVFIDEHKKRGKRFIFRSFGSMAKDYEDLLAGARLTAKDHRFEIETKATAYDFDPFLPPNPFLRKIPGCTLGAECDGMGEYFGAGYLPAAQVAVIQRYVGEARAKDVDRYTIRIDRVGNNLFDSAQEVNIYAYMRFIRDPQATPEDVMREWAAKRWKGCEAEMSALAALGFAAVSKAQFVDRNVIFHQNPPGPSMKYIKSCGICSVFRKEGDLHMTDNLWGMLHWAKMPGRAAIRAEKDEAVMLADTGLKMIGLLKGKLDPAEYARHFRAWSILAGEARAVRAFVRAICAYFDDMEAGDANATSLKAAVARGAAEIEALMKDPSVSEKGMDTIHCRAMGEDLDFVYYVPLRFLTRELLREYDADFAAHRSMKARKDVLDYVIPGGIYDDCRVMRTAMHGSYQSVDSGVPVRFVGNPTFPNATVTVEFADVPGARVEIMLDPNGTQEYVKRESVHDGVRTVSIGKKGRDYPAVRSIALVK